LVAILDSWAQFLTAIDEEKFTIFYRPGPAGQRQMVLPDAWYSNVKPGWIVELLFDNNDLNELKTKFPLHTGESDALMWRRSALLVVFQPEVLQAGQQRRM
jgi:hypothetical protein